MIMDELIYKMKSIRLSAMSEKLTVRLQEATANELSYLEFIQNLVDDEMVRGGSPLASQIRGWW